jgi:hypothetical protein
MTRFKTFTPSLLSVNKRLEKGKISVSEALLPWQNKDYAK